MSSIFDWPHRMTLHEQQTNLTRIHHAEGLISQLPRDHEGRNTWLLNYGMGPEACTLRARKGLTLNVDTLSASTPECYS